MIKLVRVVRVLEYIGPADWIEETLKQSAVTKKGTRFSLGPDKQITEIARNSHKVGTSDPVAQQLNDAYNQTLGSVEDYK